MSRLNQKQPRLRLDPENYDRLRHLVLERDGWRCQQCGRMTNLEVHHLNLRSGLGSDTLENLITLCAACHSSVHSTFTQNWAESADVPSLKGLF